MKRRAGDGRTKIHNIYIHINTARIRLPVYVGLAQAHPNYTLENNNSRVDTLLSPLPCFCLSFAMEYSVYERERDT